MTILLAIWAPRNCTELHLAWRVHCQANLGMARQGYKSFKKIYFAGSIFLALLWKTQNGQKMLGDVCSSLLHQKLVSNLVIAVVLNEMTSWRVRSWWNGRTQSWYTAKYYICIQVEQCALHFLPSQTLSLFIPWQWTPAHPIINV